MNNKDGNPNWIDKYLTALYNKPHGAGSFNSVKHLLDEIKRERKYDISKKKCCRVPKR
jgi:hypothetical protein